MPSRTFTPPPSTLQHSTQPPSHHLPHLYQEIMAAPRSRNGRRRQPRPSLLSSSVKTAIAAFTLQVGRPRLIEPAGFRDIRGWLYFLNGPSAIPAWAPLVDAILRDTNSDVRRIDILKPHIVRGIVEAVIIPRENECSKVVSTNCRRQCSRPVRGGGVTLMLILDKIFEMMQLWKQIIRGLATAQSCYTLLHYSQLMPVFAAPMRNDHVAVSTSTHPNLQYTSTPEVTHYSNQGSIAPFHLDNRHQSSPIQQPQEVANEHHQIMATSSHEAANYQIQGVQQDIVTELRPLPSFQELVESLRTRASTPPCSKNP